jgi:hypothetical protein
MVGPAIVAGDRPIPRAPVEAEIIEMPQRLPTATDPGEPVELWFAVRPLRWRGKDGTRHNVERWSDVSLPVRLVPRATQKGAIAPISDPRRKDHRGIMNSYPAPEHVIVDLDAELLPPSDLPEGFERLPVGPERKISFVEPRR